jgi:hypothetical protein
VSWYLEAYFLNIIIHAKNEDASMYYLREKTFWLVKHFTFFKNGKMSWMEARRSQDFT